MGREEDIRFPDRFVSKDQGTRFEGKTSQWTPFIHSVPFPKTGVHTATVRFDDMQSAMVGITTEKDCKKLRSFAGNGSNGISIYSNAGEIYYRGRANRGSLKSYRAPGSHVSVTYNSRTKQVSWKSNDTEWKNSHVFENDSDVYFTLSVTGSYRTTSFELLETDWVSGTEVSPLLKSMKDQIPFMDMETLLEN